MKNFILSFCLCVSGAASAQIITIPDVNFKNALANTWCADTDGDGAFDGDVDTNNDGEIQMSEALAVTSLNVSNQVISSLSGISYFSNLTDLSCEYNQLTTLDVSTLTSLNVLHCNNNQLAILDVSGLTSLSYLACSLNQLTTLDVSGLTNLNVLFCNNNQLAILEVSGLTSLTQLYCGYNQLTTLDVAALTSLNVLYCNYNYLTTLDVAGLTSLTQLYCNSNQLATLDVATLINLNVLYCSSNQLTTLDVTALTSLNNLNCYDNYLTTLDVSGLTSLSNLNCSDNQLTTLDVSASTSLNTLYCSINQLNSLFIKNGVPEHAEFSNNPNLFFICCDSTQIQDIQSTANNNGLTNCIINSDCNVAVEPVLTTEAINLNLFPNPAESLLYIPADVQITQADIFDMKGALVRSVSVRNNQIEVQGLPSGAYFTRLYSEAKLYSAKFMVK